MIQSRAHGRTYGHRSNDRANIRFKQISSHPCSISHIVSDIISNDARISRVILRYPCFNFSHKVCTDIRTLSVNPAS